MAEQRMTQPKPMKRVIRDIPEVALGNILYEAGLASVLDSRTAAAKIIATAEARDQTIMLESWL